MRLKQKKYRLILAAALLAGLGLAFGANAGQVILDSDTTNLFPDFAGSAVAPLSAPPPAQDAAAAPLPGPVIIGGRVLPDLPPGGYAVNIVSVRNISGNNPAHSTQPLLNFNGQTVSSVAQLQEAVLAGAVRPADQQGQQQQPGGSWSCEWRQYGPGGHTEILGPPAIGTIIIGNSGVGMAYIWVDGGRILEPPPETQWSKEFPHGVPSTFKVDPGTGHPHYLVRVTASPAGVEFCLQF